MSRSGPAPVPGQGSGGPVLRLQPGTPPSDAAGGTGGGDRRRRWRGPAAGRTRWARRSRTPAAVGVLAAVVVASLLGLVVAASGRSTPAPSRSAPPAGSPASGPSPGSPAAGPPAGPAPPFRWSDPTLTTPIPADAVLSSRSAGWARQLATGPALDIYEYGTGIYRADTSTPTQRVRLTQERSRGPTALSGRTVSMPTGQALLDLIPSGTDGSFVVMQPDGRHEVDIWQPVVSGSGASAHLVSASYGDYYASGNAWHDATGAVGQGTGSGKAMGAGAITDSELRAALASVGQPGGGVIHHALNFSSSISSSDYVAPAGRSDGDSGGGIPEGQRIRLDPAIDLAAIPGITPLELVIGRTLQTYGAYVTDSGGASMAFGVQLPSSVPGGSWLAEHHIPDYYNMPHLPWAAGLQVLNRWDGS